MSDLALEDAPVAGEAVDAAAVADDTPVVDDAPVVEAPAPYDPYDDPRVLELVDTRAAAIADQQLRSVLAEAQAQFQRDNQPQAPAATGLVDEFGNLNPEGLVQLFQQQAEQQQKFLEEKLASITAPLQAREMQETAAEGEQRIKDMIADDVSRNGEFPKDPETGKSSAEALIRPLADMLFPRIASQYGSGQRSAERAVAQAANIVRSLVKEAQTAGVTEHVNRNARLAGVGQEPTPGIAGVVTLPDGPQAPGSIADKYAQNASAFRYGT